MPRQIDTATLDEAARHYAGEWMRPDRKSPSGLLYIGGPAYVLQDFQNFTFKDEFDYLLDGIKQWLGARALGQFEKAAKGFIPRDDGVFQQLLKERLAIDPDGNHIDGAIGTTELGNRIVGHRQKIIKTRRLGEVALLKHVYWPIYAGETEERIAGHIRTEIGVGAGADPLPPGAVSPSIGATNPNISAEAAIAGCDAIVDRLDEGSTAATIRGRTGAQPADPDAAETGTLLFTLTMSATAFGNAADDAPGGLATAAAITDDSSADATGTLAYCRCGATGTGADDHIDGEAGTSASDFNFNTLAITSGSTVSMSAFTVEVPQGATAT